MSTYENNTLRNVFKYLIIIKGTGFLKAFSNVRASYYKKRVKLGYFIAFNLLKIESYN